MSREEHGRLPLDVGAAGGTRAAEEEWRASHNMAPMPECELRNVIDGLALPPAKHVPRVQAGKAGRGRW